MPAVAADSALESGLVRRYRQAWLFKLVVVLATLATAALTLLVLLVPLFAIDVSLERAVQSVQTPWLDSLASGLSWTGFPPQSNVLFGALIVALFLRALRWEAAGTLFAAAGSAGLWFLIAPLVHRARPDPNLVRVAVEIPYGSFPSGHGHFRLSGVRRMARRAPEPLSDVASAAAASCRLARVSQ